MRFDAIFFDSGGTLYQTDLPPDLPAGLSRETLRDRTPQRVRLALEGLGYTVSADVLNTALPAAEQAVRQRHGGRLTYHFSETMLELLRALKLPAREEEAAMLAESYAGPRYAEWLFPGTREMLAALAEHGARLGLIANTAWPSWTMDRAFHGVGLLRYLPVRVYSGDEGVAKPDPEIFRLAARRAGLTGTRILYVGDDLKNDIEGPKGLGWSAALRRSRHASSSGRADFEFDAGDELVRWVAG